MKIKKIPDNGLSLPKTQNWQTLLKLFADNVPVLISYVDTKERYLFNNRLYEEWFGFTREEAYGKHVSEIRGIDAYKILKPYLRKALSGQEVSYDNILYKSSGEKIYVTVKFIPHINDENIIEGVFVHVIDITKRKYAEIKLKESENKFRKLVDSNVIGVTVTDLDGNIYEANDVYLRMLGFTRQEFDKGTVNWLKQTPPEYNQINEKAKKEILSKGAATPYEKEYLRKDGSRVPVLIGNVLLDKQQRKLIAFILDMSKQKELQQRKDEFIALASHELKTPLTSLKLFSQMMGHNMKHASDKKSYDLYAKMDKQINKLNRLVNSLLDVSRIQAGKLAFSKSKFSYTRLVNETVHEIQKIHENYTFLIQSSAEASIRADRERIKQVLTNLLTNAVKYSPKDTTITVSVTKKDQMIMTAVKDQGMGIPSELLNTIFDRYYQVDTLGKKTNAGMGLGLYLAKDIVDRHNGEIWVESEVGKSTTFFFSLPISSLKNAE